MEHYPHHHHQPATTQGDEPEPDIARRQLLAAGSAAGLTWFTSGWPLDQLGQTTAPPQAADQAALGERLYRLVKEYADLGDHRTGTPADEATSKWFAAQLAARGATVERQEYGFDRYDARAKVTVDGKEVAIWPLYYEAIGRVKTDKPYTGQVEIVPGSGMRMSTVLTQVRQTGAPAAVIATTGAGGRLIALNRRPTLGQGPPTIFVPGALADKLSKAKVTVDFEAELKPARSANVIGHFGTRTDRPPVLVAVQLSGWFRCAGERGTSLAVALEVASEMAKIRPVVMVGTTGQELFGLGARHYLEQVQKQTAPRPSAIVHYSGSLAAGARDKSNVMKLAGERYAATSLSKERHDKLAQALRPLNLQTTNNVGDDARNPNRWRGEARLWCLFGVPLLSFAGTFPLFHTPDDLPEQATSPALLAEVSRLATETARMMLTER